MENFIRHVYYNFDIVCKGVCSLTHGWNAPYTQTKEASNNAPITFNIIWIMAALYFDVFVIFSA